MACAARQPLMIERLLLLLHSSVTSAACRLPHVACCALHYRARPLTHTGFACLRRPPHYVACRMLHVTRCTLYGGAILRMPIVSLALTSLTGAWRRRGFVAVGRAVHRWLQDPIGHPRHIYTRTGLTPATSAPGLGSPPPHLQRDCMQALSVGSPSPLKRSQPLTPISQNKQPHHAAAAASEPATSEHIVIQFTGFKQA